MALLVLWLEVMISMIGPLGPLVIFRFTVVVKVGCKFLGMLVRMEPLMLLEILTLLAVSSRKAPLRLSLDRTFISELPTRLGRAILLVTESSSGSGKIAEDDASGGASVAS